MGQKMLYKEAQKVPFSFFLIEASIVIYLKELRSSEINL